MSNVQTPVMLNAKQIQMILGCLYEAKVAGLVPEEDLQLWSETDSIIAEAENVLYLEANQ